MSYISLPEGLSLHTLITLFFFARGQGTHVRLPIPYFFPHDVTLSQNIIDSLCFDNGEGIIGDISFLDHAEDTRYLLICR